MSDCVVFFTTEETVSPGLVREKGRGMCGVIFSGLGDFKARDHRRWLWSMVLWMEDNELEIFQEGA